MMMALQTLCQEARLLGICLTKPTSKYRYHIYPDRIYVLEYDGYQLEITGSDLLDKFEKDKDAGL